MEFIVQKIGMSRTVSVPSTPVTLLKVLDTKVCEVTDGVAIVSYSNGKSLTKLSKVYKKNITYLKSLTDLQQLL